MADRKKALHGLLRPFVVQKTPRLHCCGRRAWRSAGFCNGCFVEKQAYRRCFSFGNEVPLSVRLVIEYPENFIKCIENTRKFW